MRGFNGDIDIASTSFAKPIGMAVMTFFVVGDDVAVRKWVIKMYVGRRAVGVLDGGGVDGVHLPFYEQSKFYRLPVSVTTYGTDVSTEKTDPVLRATVHLYY